ncbi:MAG: acyl-CoA dehydrogenase [Nocardia sp.]|nr:acyl-CoA dehydrogenase [Nocardia sp.]
MDASELELLTQSLRKAATSTTGSALYAGLTELGWQDLLIAYPERAIPLVFRLLGETGAHAPVLNDVVRHAAGQPLGATVPLPYAGGSWVVWEDSDTPATDLLDPQLPLHRAEAGPVPPLAAGRRALGWWLLGSAHAMLELARTHALQRVQFGRPLSSFQAVRHRLAETLVAIEGAEATLIAADDEFSSLLAKAAAGHSALTAARHCQQVLGGLGFTAEHGLQQHIRRVLVLDGLLGSARELTREAGAHARATGSAPRLVHL